MKISVREGGTNGNFLLSYITLVREEFQHTYQGLLGWRTFYVTVISKNSERFFPKNNTLKGNVDILKPEL